MSCPCSIFHLSISVLSSFGYLEVRLGSPALGIVGMAIRPFRLVSGQSAAPISVNVSRVSLISHSLISIFYALPTSPYPCSLLVSLPHSVSCRAVVFCPCTELTKPRNSMPAPPQIQLATPTPLPAPQIKILRRQAPSSNNTEGEGGKTIAQKTYAEKEEEYRLARERIFGAGGGGGGGSRGSSTSTSPAPTPGQTQQPPSGRIRTPDTGVLRQPKGPGEGGGFGVASGFGNGPGSGQGGTNPSIGNGNLPGSQNGVGQFPPGW